ncbi:MAG: energy transducer TonB [Pseudomonadota bacterium]
MRALWLVIISVVAIAHHTLATAQEDGLADVIAAHNTFIEDGSDDARGQLLAALSAYNGPPAVQSVNAYLTLMNRDATGDNYQHIRQSARATETHLMPVRSVLPKHYVEAKYIAAVALFNDRQDRDAILEMTHVEGFARAHFDDAGEKPEWTEDLKWKAEAWRMAMQAYFESTGESHPAPSEIQEILATYPVDEHLLNALEIDSNIDTDLPQCSGRMIQRPGLRYPAGKARRGMFGAVILQLQFDENGNVVNPRVLASVPNGVFDDRSLSTVEKWRFKPDDPEAVGATCRIQASNVVQPLVFQLR